MPSQAYNQWVERLVHLRLTPDERERLDGWDTRPASSMDAEDQRLSDRLDALHNEAEDLIRLVGYWGALRAVEGE